MEITKSGFKKCLQQGILYITSNIIKTYCHCFSLWLLKPPHGSSDGALKAAYKVFLRCDSAMKRPNQKQILRVKTVAFRKRMATSPAKVFCYNLNLSAKIYFSKSLVMPV